MSQLLARLVAGMMETARPTEASAREDERTEAFIDAAIPLDPDPTTAGDSIPDGELPIAALLDERLAPLADPDPMTAPTTGRPPLSVYALCGNVTPNRANVPYEDVVKLFVRLGEYVADPTGPIGCQFSPIPGMHR